MAVPEAISFKEESEETKQLYGLDNDTTKSIRRRSASQRGAFPSAASGSCRSITAARATPGTRTRI